MKPKRTYVYIDGFNFYYGLLKNSEHKWLDVSKLVPYLFPGGVNNVVKIKYFTAKVNARPDDPKQPERQETYLRALRTIPNLQIFLGQFLSNGTWQRLVHWREVWLKPKNVGTSVPVMKTQEKGSDVNLATHLLIDAMDGLFDVAIVFSSDSDLAYPISVAKDRFKREVIVVYSSNYLHASLAKAASFPKQMRRGAYLSGLQFPESLTDRKGRTITIPTEWKNIQKNIRRSSLLKRLTLSFLYYFVKD